MVYLLGHVKFLMRRGNGQMLAFELTQYTGVTFRIAKRGELLLIPDYNV